MLGQGEHNPNTFLSMQIHQTNLRSVRIFVGSILGPRPCK
jgi:hypothetical protein